MSGYGFSARQLANYIVDKCAADGHPISNLQLQKMLFFMQYIYCQVTGLFLFDDEFEAWPYGPVMRDVYFDYSNNNGNLIYDVACTDFGSIADLSFNMKMMLNQLIDVLRERSPWDLVQISHASDSPWHQIWNGGKGQGCRIPNDLIKGKAHAAVSC